MVTQRQSHVQWVQTFRLINSAHPPISLFEDIADPEDWELLGSAESKTNPRISETIGNLDLVPMDRRVGGPGASYLMAPFTHVSPEVQGRFHDGTYGAYYAADCFAAAVAETVFHTARFLHATSELPGWVADKRELIGAVDAHLIDVRNGPAEVLDPDSYAASQRFARHVKDEGANGIVYPSVRHEGSACVAVFYPDVVSIPKQGRHLSYHWNGSEIDLIRDYSSGQVYRLEH